MSAVRRKENLWRSGPYGELHLQADVIGQVVRHRFGRISVELVGWGEFTPEHATLESLYLELWTILDEDVIDSIRVGNSATIAVCGGTVPRVEITAARYLLLAGAHRTLEMFFLPGIDEAQICLESVQCRSFWVIRRNV